MTLEVRQLVIRSELGNGNGNGTGKPGGGARDAAGEEPCCAGDKAISADRAERRAREHELRRMLERLGER